jgi:uncharacterized protein (TIGR02246 family)
MPGVTWSPMKVFLLFAVLFAGAGPRALHAMDAESQINAVLKVQVDAWNRGDIPGFVSTYASDCIFVGKAVAHGRAQLLARYKKTYPTREAMGHLTFSGLEIHLLSDAVALVTGEWHIDRSGADAKRIGGLFSLVFHGEDTEWKIALDHTS